MVALNKQVSITILLVIVLIAAITVLLIWEYQYQNNQKMKTDNNSPKAEALVQENSGGGKPVSLNSKMKVRRNICESPACITLAHQMQNWMDPTVDPCVDFFKYSCGNYVQHVNHLSGTRTTKSSILNRIMDDFFHKHSKNPSVSSSKSERTMSLLYQKCERLKDPEKIPSEIEKSLDDLKLDIEKIGPWPMVDQNFDDSKFNVNEYLENMAKLSLINFGLFQVKEHYKLFIVGLDKNKETLHQKSELISFITKYYFTRHGFKMDDKVRKDLEAVDAFVVELKKISLHGNSFVDFHSKNSTFSLINFERILRSLVHTSNNYEGIKEKLRFSEAPYFFNETSNMEVLIKKTPSRVLANFLIMHFIHEVFEFIPTRFRSFVNCGYDVMIKFPLPALQIFVHHYFDKRNLKAVDEMTENIREAYIQYFNESTKLDDETRNEAIKKVKMMKNVIGYPKELEKQNFGEESFESTDLSQTDTFYTMNMKTKRLSFQQIIDFAMNKIIEWPTTNWLEVNAFYYSTSNSFNILVPYMDEPLFDFLYPASSKYGALGASIGHEMGHGFDKKGRTFDENGKERNWWKEDALNEYNKGVDCLKKQYEEYDDPDHGKNLKGDPHIKEIIADRLGSEISFIAFQRAKLDDEQGMPGMEGATQEQLFFRVNALKWCRGRDPVSLDFLLKKGIHPTNSFRVNGVVANSRGFAKAFNCPVGSPMNREDKCDLF